MILFSFLGSAFKDVAQERILDTLIGCAIAFFASHMLFPSWESEQLKNFMQGIVKANAAYLKKILEALSGKKPAMLDYKLARKDVYLNSANLSAASQRMLSEPKSKQVPQTQLHHFVVLNHTLFSNIATIATYLMAKEQRPYPAELIHLGRKTYFKLEESSRNLGNNELLADSKLEELYPVKGELTADDMLMREQLQFIYRASSDIEKITRSIG